MSTFDWGGVMKGVLGELEQQALPGVLSQVLAKTNLGSMQGLVNQLQQAGLDKQVGSWLSNHPNLPVTPAQLRTALNDKQLQQIARSMGVPVDQALQTLAKYLPGVVDQMSPDGVIKTQ